jgi:hypothetical protein
VRLRCCVWQVATLVFAAGDEVACVEAVAGVWTPGVLGVWTPEVVGVWTPEVAGVWTPEVLGVWDELDEVGLDVEAHPVRNDVVITISPATTGIDFFISSTVHQGWITKPR